MIYAEAKGTDNREGCNGCDIGVLPYAGYTGLAIGLKHSSAIIGEAEDGFFPRAFGSRVVFFCHGVYLERSGLLSLVIVRSYALGQ